MNQHNIDTVLNRIQQKWGQTAIQSAHRIRSIERKTLTTGFASLDEMIEGIPSGHISEIIGKPTSGMSTLAYYLMASAQNANQHVVFVDMGTTFSGQYATTCGVNVDDMVLVEAQEQPLVLELLREIVCSGVVGLVIVNLLSIKQRQIDLRRVMNAIHGADCAVVLLLPAFAQSNVATLRLRIQRRNWLRSEGDIIGCLSQVTIEKQRAGKIGQSTLLLIPFNQEAWA